MNNFLICSLGNFFKFIILTFVSTFNLINYNENKISNYNIDQLKTTYEDKKIDKYEKIEIETFKMNYGEKNIIKQGQDGIYYYSNNQLITIKEKVDEIVEVGISKKGEYLGTMTGYGPDCVGCSPFGNVSCTNRYGENHSLISDGIYYNDESYKNLRILAADHREFPCGTIVEFTNFNFTEPIMGIVLDTGFSMKKAYNNNEVHMDLAFESENKLNGYYSTDSRTSFKVKRWGW